MFWNNKKIIIELSRNVLKTYLFVSPKKSPRKTGEHAWTSDNLEGILVKIKKDNKVKKVRVLLNDDLGYLMQVDIPSDVNEKGEREYIFQIISEKIPEVLGDSEWDFVEMGRSKENKRVRVFAPVEGIWQTFIKACEKIQLEIEAVETISLATERNSNAIIGLGIKKDIKGKDQNVLNVVPGHEDSEENKRPSSAPIIVLVVILVLLSVSGAIYYFLKIY